MMTLSEKHLPPRVKNDKHSAPAGEVTRARRLTPARDAPAAAQAPRAPPSRGRGRPCARAQRGCRGSRARERRPLGAQAGAPREGAGRAGPGELRGGPWPGRAAWTPRARRSAGGASRTSPGASFRGCFPPSPLCGGRRQKPPRAPPRPSRGLDAQARDAISRRQATGSRPAPPPATPLGSPSRRRERGVLRAPRACGAQCCAGFSGALVARSDCRCPPLGRRPRKSRHCHSFPPAQKGTRNKITHLRPVAQSRERVFRPISRCL